jgi:hypothetical protein
VTASTSQMVAILGSGAAFGVLGWITRWIRLPLIPLTGMTCFLAAMVLNDDWYARVPEDIQATIASALALGSLAAFVGVLLARTKDGRARA